MKFDATLFLDDLKVVPTLAQQIEAMGFDALWVPEAAHNPYMGLALAGHATQHLGLGTAIAVAFARSPTLTAYEAWDLARLTDGRFMLGIGTQIKAHITRRFGMSWDRPVAQMREYIQVLRALWNTFQHNERINFRGEYYKITFMNPFFQPEPIAHPNIPIYVAAVGPAMCKLVGELCDGIHIHSFHTVEYIKQVILPNLQAGLLISGRSREAISLNTAVFVVTDEQEKQEVKAQIAFYASTPAYRGVLELHGWGEVQDRLSNLARHGKWNDMHQEISDEMLNTFAVVAPPDDIGAAVRERYTGLLDRVGLYLKFIPGERDAFWKKIIAAFH
jgi:probable F420-dependent oxidoreductase